MYDCCKEKLEFDHLEVKLLLNILSQVSHYSMRFKSSDTSIMSDPVPAIPRQGIVEQSITGESNLFLQIA